MTDAIRHEAAATGETPLLSGPEDADGDDAPHKLAVIAAGPHESGALRELAASLPPSVTAAVSHPCFLEVTAAGVDKATGLRPLAAHLGIRTDDAAAVGDGPNDLALFAAVGLPVAKGQAPPEVRAAAAWVTTSNAEDGVARALAHLGLTDEVVTPASAPVRTAP
jgi:hydroxymethylpyrimidine pyrophosphatase-like HAD family hydrolase